MISRNLIILLFIAVLGLSSCYKDKAELLQLGVGCDTTNVTYALTISPIIKSNCEGCHSGGAPSGGILLTNYPEIKSAADNGRLMGTIRHEAGFSPMPKGGNSLSDCDIKKLEIWIKNGTLNN